jgi:uncharacterized OsmC-like protein
MAQAEVRKYAAKASSTDTFGRVMCSSRNHHFVVDGPVWNNCPGEAITPSELFLAAIAACGVELVQLIAKSKTIALAAIAVDIEGAFDRSRPVRPDVSLLNPVRLHFRMKGVTEEQGRFLVEQFKGK